MIVSEIRVAFLMANGCCWWQSFSAHFTERSPRDHRRIEEGSRAGVGRIGEEWDQCEHPLFSGGKVVATEKAIAFPVCPVLTIDSSDFAFDISLSKTPSASNAVVVFVNGLMQPPADYSVTDGKLSFKDPSHYAKGDTVNIVYLAA